MSQLRVRIGEGDKAQTNLLWDSVWNSWLGGADWAIADDTEALNRGGLRSQATLATAIVLCLFTDKRIPDDHPLRKYVDDGDPRGWWGDDIDVRADLGEDELGSLLWVFERVPLTDEVILELEAEAQTALAVLTKQGAAARIDVQVFPHKPTNRCDLAVQVYGRDGSRLHDIRFDDIWKQAVSK